MLVNEWLANIEGTCERTTKMHGEQALSRQDGRATKADAEQMKVCDENQ